MTKILSVVIPMYNMHDHISKCVSSLLRAEQVDDIDVVVVNDGSTDDSLSIARSFESSHPDTVRVIDKPNGHYGSAVNAGLAVAVGKYVKTLDSDDWFDSAVFDDFISALKTTDADCVMSNYVDVYSDGTVARRHRFPFEGENVISVAQLVADEWNWHFRQQVVTYKTELVRSVGYRQVEGVSYSDNQWVSSPFARVRTVYVFGGCLYQYLIGREGQSVGAAFLKSHFRDFFAVFRAMMDDRRLFEGSAEDNVRLHEKCIDLFVRDKYRKAIVQWPDELRDEIEEFDALLKNWPDVYERAASIRLSRHYPVKLVAMWRKGHDSLRLRMAVALLNFFHK